MQAEKSLDPATLDALVIECHNVRHPEELSPEGWTDEWVFGVLLTVLPVRASRQEAEALRNFERSQRSIAQTPINPEKLTVN